jgi:hypothetical protein
VRVLFDQCGPVPLRNAWHALRSASSFLKYFRSTPRAMPLPLRNPGTIMRSKVLSAVLLLPFLCASLSTLAADQPLPDVATLLKQVERNQERLEKDREKYSFTEVAEQDDVVRNGHAKTTVVRQYDVFFLHGYLIRRLVRKDGEPLSALAQKNVDARVRKRIEKDEHRTRIGAGLADQPVEIDDLLRVSRFDQPRWETLRGHRLLVFDFEPTPGYRPKTLAEKIAHSLAGEIWVDPEAREVVRMQARFDTSFKVGRGLLTSIEKGASVVTEQTLVDGDIWLPSYTSTHVNARMLLFKGFRMNVVDHYSDYRVFHVDSLSTILGPKEKAPAD